MSSGTRRARTSAEVNPVETAAEADHKRGGTRWGEQVPPRDVRLGGIADVARQITSAVISVPRTGAKASGVGPTCSEDADAGRNDDFAVV